MSAVSRADGHSRLPRTLKAARAIYALAGLLLLVPAAFYAYLDIDPSEPGPGDLAFGDGTGFVIAALFACLAMATAASGLGATALWRRGHRSEGVMLAALAPLAWLGLPLMLARTMTS